MAELIVNTPATVELETTGYMGEPTGEIALNENGTFDVKPYATAKVQVPDPPTMEKEISDNGEYIAAQEDVYGYSKVVVNVQPLLIAKTISDNGEYTAALEGADGYSKVVVNVDLPSAEEVAY